MKKSDTEVLILAGGRGTRLEKVVADRPKPMALIAGYPFLEYLLCNLKKQGFEKITISVGYKAELIQDYFSDGESFKIEIKYLKEDQPLGTGGAIAKAFKQSSASELMVLNGDSFLNTDLNLFLQKARQVAFPASLALCEVENTSRYGGVELQKNIIQKFTEKNDQPVKGLINAGIYLLNREIENFFKQEVFSFEKEILEKISEKKLVQGILCPGHFIDIGLPESYAQAQFLIPSWIPFEN